MDKRKITIRDVAAAAGVSVTSVSRHLNGQISLPPLTASRIDEAAAELKYRPNALARRLTNGSSEALGLVVSDITYPLFASIASACEEEATRHGYSLVMFNSRNIIENEIAFISRLEDRQVDGILLLTNHRDDGRLMKKINQNRGVVLLDEDVPGALAPRLFADSEGGAYLATRHLIEKGHQKIAVIGGPRGLLSTEERIKGFERAMREAGFQSQQDYLSFHEYSDNEGFRSFERLMALQSPPTAIFTFADTQALGVLRAARTLKIGIPKDVSLVSFDDIANADLLEPALTTVRQPAGAFGRRGVNILLDFIADKTPATYRERVAVELVVRNSVGPPKR
ncbi:LacI family DNA-binding transcriptional regulator [Rhizobium sp. CG5]|uniref:LacI family DNA-binding transcriptional regulator n=1 Tax=Rhizobium sp. CG5 TaxID=2726076 RepID=UPI00203344AC|nr:LacI family DNA-binding transcriptional regulator [Rhizobium sp. CG5]